MSELRALLARHCQGDLTPSSVPRLILAQSKSTTSPTAGLYYPVFCVIAQGRKRVLLGNEEFVYDPSTYLVASADLPVSGQVIEAPFLGFMMSLDPGILAELLLEMPTSNSGKAASKAIAVSALEGELLDAVLRFLRLLDQPNHIAVLAPIIEREILYRLLLGPRGEMLRQLALPASPLSQVRRAIDVIRNRYDEPLRVEELAHVAGMSAPSLHRHFRAVTAMSPLQFQKKIRLQEARRRLLSEHTDAASVGFEVGYESPSQFSREYRRLFGAPPGQDAKQVRRMLVRG